MIAAVALAVPARAAADAPVEAYGAVDGGGFHDVFATAPGWGQLPMWRDLLGAVPGLTNTTLPSYFKDATFGVRADDVAGVVSPRADATIVRDAGYGIPHVYGTTRDGAMFGLGYAAAQDRLFAMDVLRHAGRAELSSFIGGAAQREDARQWRFAPYTEADLTRQADQLPRLLGFRGQTLLRDVDQYVAGVNAYIATLRAAPPEYAAIGRRGVPPRWTREDVVAAAAAAQRELGPADGGELDAAGLREALTTRFGARRGLRVLGELTGAAPARARRAALPDPGSVQQAVTASPPPPAVPGGPSAGAADALLVGHRHARKGRPIMVAGPQVGGVAGAALMEEDVHAPASAGLTGVDARGAAIAGVAPYVAFGHGRDYAWSAGGGGTDGTDTFAVELCDPSGAPATTASTAYLFRGACLPMEELTRTNRWTPNPTDATPAGAQTLRAERTALGLVIARGTVRGRPVAFTSLRATYLHELDFATGLMALDEPASLRSPVTFARALLRVGVPSRWFYADERHVASFTAGADPVRGRHADPGLPQRAGNEWQGWDPATWTARQHGRKAHPRAAYRPQVATGAAAGALRAAVRGHRRVALAGVVSIMETSATADSRARAVLPVALRLVGRPRSRALRTAVAELRRWLRGGALRRDRDGNGVYEHPDAIRVADAWLSLLPPAVLAPRLGPDAFAALRTATGGSWAGVLARDLRAALKRGGARGLCGGGTRKGCRHVLLQSLGAAVATPASTVYPAQGTCAAGDPLCHDAMDLGGGQVVPRVQRPLFQQALAIRRRVTPPSSSCGGVRHAHPRPPADGSAPPLLIGDSVALGALPELKAAGYEIDARACRGFAEGLEVLRLRRDTQTLPRFVVMELGTDGSVHYADIRRALRAIGPRRVLGLVTPREIFGHATSDAKNMRRAARYHRSRVLLLDWVRYSRDHAGWFGPDEVHLSLSGAGAFGDFLRRALAPAAVLLRRPGGR